MKDPAVAIDTATALAQFKGTDAERDDVKLLGIRGFFSNENEMGIYDDLICSIIDGVVKPFRASTDPGRYWIQHPMNPKGCARLRPGLVYFGLGMHLSSHPALVQHDDCPFTVDRLSVGGKVVSKESGHFGINNHSGGPEWAVGRYSAGCQIIHSPDGAWSQTWLDYYVPVRKVMVDRSMKRIPYLLIEHPKAIPAVI